MHNNIRIALGGPILLQKSKLEDVATMFESAGDDAFLDRYDDVQSREAANESLAYEVSASGQAIIRMSGVLVHKLGIDGSFWGLQGYDGLERQVLHADVNPEVSEIVLDIDSVGGMVHGVIECARVISGANKPVTAFVNETAASAAYWLACAADKIVAVAGSDVGSIGVLSVHTDASGAYEAAGLKHTVFKAGERKDMGAEHRPVSDDEAAEWQANVDDTYDRFVDWVAKQRPISSRSVRETEARVYRAEEAKRLGLIDEVVTKDDVLKDPAPRGSGVESHEGDFAMAKEEGRAQAVDKEAIEQAVAAALKSERDEAKARQDQAVKEAIEAHQAESEAKAKEEKARVDGIMSLDAAKGRESFAAVVAATGLPVEEAQKLLEAAPQSYSSQMDEAGGAGIDGNVGENQQESASNISLVGM